MKTGFGRTSLSPLHGLRWGTTQRDAVLWDSGDVVVLTGVYTNLAEGINDRGLIVGFVSSPGHIQQPFYYGNLWVRGVGYDLNTLLDPPSRSHWNITDALAINPSDQIVACARQAATDAVYIVVLAPATGS